MKSSGHADLPLHRGKVPLWLTTRMATLGGAIIEAVVMEYGKDEVLRKLSDPFWFQSLGSVLGMDWHSSGITTSVMGALKKAINPISTELGIYICGGRGKHSLKTPEELMRVAERTGLNGSALARNSRLVAKVDNTAIQDGFQLYLHSFIVTNDGQWAVIQQGLNNKTGMARRYHWHSGNFSSFTEQPHSAICGTNQGRILNLTSKNAGDTKQGIMSIAREDFGRLEKEIRQLVMPNHHDVRAENIDLKRLGSVLALAQTANIEEFDDLLLTQGLGQRTLQSLTLVSEIIHGTPSRFSDPARFSFAHGGKDGHPFPVPLKVYDKSIESLRTAIDKAKIGFNDKRNALAKLHTTAMEIEKTFQPNANFDEVIATERRDSCNYGGMTVNGPAKPQGQLHLPF